MSFCAVNDDNVKRLIVVWDLGRKCTYACSYCPPHRKNNWSETANFDELCSTADSLERYSKIYNSKRKHPLKVSASFTGGEPTVNPDFFRFLEYLSEKYPHWNRTLTTNGFYSERKLQVVMNTTSYSTISYHCEGTPEQKRQVRKNIEIMKNSDYGFKINIMFHQQDEYFNECIELAKWCDDNEVSYVPRVIGDQGEVKEGLKNKTVHVYSEDQLSWMTRYWEAKNSKSDKPAHVASANVRMNTPIEKHNNPPKEKIVGQTIGRPCCGDREMDLMIDGEWTKSAFVKDNNFNDWSCMINWYFLYIHQEVDAIWHHQTCQVNLEGGIGPICKVSEFDKFCDELQVTMDSGKMPYIRCPKTYCGCGLCTPKAKNDKLATELFMHHTIELEPILMNKKDISHDTSRTLRHVVYNFDKENGNETI